MTRVSSLLILLCAACGPQSPPVAPSGGGEGGDEPAAGTSSAVTAEQAQGFLEAHNSRRAKHCAEPLTWSDELAASAQAWSDELTRQSCAFEHSNNPDVGESLAGGDPGALDPEKTVQMWYGEVDQYDFEAGVFTMETGHFTQVVWKGTKEVGCGVTTCGDMDIIVCHYAPSGNYEGQYQENVVPEGC
jgi:uncharacterized protein YkwD